MSKSCFLVGTQDGNKPQPTSQVTRSLYPSAVVSDGLVGRLRAGQGSGDRLRSSGRGSRPEEPRETLLVLQGLDRAVVWHQEIWAQILQVRELRLRPGEECLSQGHIPQTGKGIKTKIWIRICRLVFFSESTEVVSWGKSNLCGTSLPLQCGFVFSALRTSEGVPLPGPCVACTF